jgi:murein DD-endopeptidase MepM/ murein hydrolase activator NlpD
MSGRHAFVPCLARARKLQAIVLAATAAGAILAGDGRIAPRPTARAFEPGEIVRFEVGTDEETTALSGTFFSAPLTFVRVPGPGRGAAWVGWGVIPLDAPAGRAAYRLTSTRSDRSSVSISAELEVGAKSFPEQRLEVEPKFVNPPKSVQARIDRERRKLAAIYARRTPLQPPAAPFVRPVPGEPTSEFGTRRVFNGEPRAPHAGIDLRAATGTPVAASGPGRIALAANLYYSGGTVIVDHGEGLFTIYAHLSKIEAKDGASVNEGDRVGLSGATGRVTGPHLHWGARVGEAIFDPRALLDPRLFGATTGPASP